MTDNNSLTNPSDRSKFASRGKYCICGHGVGAHSIGIKVTHCQQCSCRQYERDFNNVNDWARRKTQ